MELTESPQNTALTESKFKADDVVRLSVCLSQELIALRSYGKTGDDIPALTEAFLLKFKQHEPAKVIAAIEKWGIEGTGDFPTPPDINKILNPKPIYDKSVYLEMIARRKRNEERYGDSEYMRAYEKQVVNG